MDPPGGYAAQRRRTRQCGTKPLGQCLEFKLSFKDVLLQEYDCATWQCIYSLQCFPSIYSLNMCQQSARAGGGGALAPGAPVDGAEACAGVVQQLLGLLPLLFSGRLVCGACCISRCLSWCQSRWSERVELPVKSYPSIPCERASSPERHLNEVEVWGASLTRIFGGLMGRVPRVCGSC